MCDIVTNVTNVHELIKTVTQASTHGEGIDLKDLDELGVAIAKRCVETSLLVNFRGRLYVKLVEYPVSSALMEMWINSARQ